MLGIFFSLIGLGLLAGIAVFAYLYTTTEVPQPEKFALAEKTTVYYADGTTAIGSYAEQNREIISCEGLPDYIGNAIVASENRTFYTDKGLDLKGIARAFINNVTKGTRQGGSTITQQYAERYYMGETTSYVGKAREAIMAIKIAQTESKDEVLCNYMNTIYLGRNSYGIQAAAKAYFNKDAKDLTLSEAAMIAGIIPSPSRRPPRWRSRTNTRGRTVICWIWCAASWCSPRPLPKRIWILADTRSSPPSTRASRILCSPSATPVWTTCLNPCKSAA